MESSFSKPLSKPGRKHDAVLMGRMQHKWAIIGMPPGSSLSTTQLSGSRAACASFDPDLPGSYEFGFTLKSHGSTYYEHVKVLVLDRKDPLASQKANQADPCNFVVWKSFADKQPTPKVTRQQVERKLTVQSHARGDASDASVNEDHDDEQDESRDDESENDPVNKLALLY
jgi:hypothetical protein